MSKKYYTLSYTCLLACGLFFSKDAINQYFERKTAFHTSQQKLTIEDLPVVTVCYEGFDDHYDSSNKSLNWTISYLLWFNEEGYEDLKLHSVQYR